MFAARHLDDAKAVASALGPRAGGWLPLSLSLGRAPAKRVERASLPAT